MEPDEHRISEASQKRIQELLQTYEHSPCGKTMENVWKRVNIKIVRSDDRKKVRKLIASHLFAGYTLFSDDPAGFRMHKECAKLNKPICSGMTILDNSKIMMYDFHYNDLKRQYGPKRGLIYTDTDSLMQEIKTNDVYKDMGSKRNCDYPKDHPLYSSANNKVLGKMKDEMKEVLIIEYICLRQKM